MRTEVRVVLMTILFVCQFELMTILFVGGRLNARKRKVQHLRASQSLPETFPCADYKAFPLKGVALRGNRIARIGS